MMGAQLADELLRAAVAQDGPAAVPVQFGLSEDQVLLCDTLRRFFRARAEARGLGRGPIDPSEWQELATLGLSALLLPERAGGLGGQHRDAAVIAEEFGRALAITPLAEGLVAAAWLVGQHGDEAAIERWVSPALNGSTTLALGIGAVRLDAQGRLSGAIPFVRWAPRANAIVVAHQDHASIVDARAPGISLEAHALVDGTPTATVRMLEVRGHRLALPPGALASTLAVTQLCYVAEMVGAMTLLYDQTVDYVRQRHQFGVAIGTFQVVQHKIARMFVMLEQARSISLKATLCDRKDNIFVQHVTAAKAYVADVAQRLAEEAVQLHGGIGITDELVVGRGLRRIAVLARLFGGPEEARAQLAA